MLARMADASGSGGSPSNIEQFPYTNPEPKDGGTSGGGGTGGGSPEISMKDYIDAQDEKTRAQNDARFARIETKLGELKIPGIWQTVSVAVGAVVAIIGMNAIMADRFEGGIGISNVLDSVINAQEQRDAGQDRKLDLILLAVEQIRDNPQGSPAQR